jgi:hypothetical protein
MTMDTKTEIPASNDYPFQTEFYSPMNEIPIELWREIFKLLCLEEQVNLIQTCKYFNEKMHINSYHIHFTYEIPYSVVQESPNRFTCVFAQPITKLCTKKYGRKDNLTQNHNFEGHLLCCQFKQQPIPQLALDK